MRTLTLICLVIILCVSQILAKSYRTSLSNDAVLQRILHNLSQKYLHSYLKHTNDGGHFEFVQHYPRQYGGLNKVLVKRKVPHGQRNTGIEYNPNYRGWYRPLYKVSRKPDNNDFDTIVFTNPPRPPNNKSSKKRTLYSNVLKLLSKKYLRSQAKKNTVSKLVNDIRTLLETPPREINVPLKEGGIVESVLKKLGYTTKLRMSDDNPNERSGELHDPYSPGKLPATIVADQLDEEQKKQKKHTFWLPEYSPWNFWTYHKTIIQDDCPLNQIKLNHICVWAPPHRRK